MTLSNVLRGIFGPVPAHPDPEVVLRHIEEAHDVAAVPRIMFALFSSSPVLAAAAAEKIRLLASALTPEALASAEENVRSAWASYDHGRRDGAHLIEELVRVLGHSPAEVLGLLSFHSSGYVREAAVNSLDAISGGQELPYLLLRMNDWVAEVREAATRAVFARMCDAYVTAFTRNCFLVERVARGLRADGVALLQVLKQLLANEQAQRETVILMQSGPLIAARAAVRFQLEHAPSISTALVAAGVTADDAMIRAWMAPLISRSLPPADALPILERLITDSSPIVRREALRTLAGTFPARAHSPLERAALDSSASVRELARSLLAGTGIDFAAMYRSALQPSARAKRLASALSGLSAVGAAADARLAAPYLADPRASVRRAAIQCVMRLDGEAFLEKTAAMLQDSSRGVSAAARKTLRTHAPVLGAAALRTIFDNARSQHTKLNVIYLFAELPKWQSITPLIEAVMDEDERVASLARTYVHAWNHHYNGSQAAPSRFDIQMLGAVVERASFTLDERSLAELRFVIRSFQ